MSRLSTVPVVMPNLRKRKRRGRYAVALFRSYLTGWKPTRLHSVPQFVTSVEWLARNLRATDAATIAQAYNASHFGDDYRGAWAVVVSACFPIIPELMQPAEPCSCRDHALVAIGGEAVARG